MSTKKVVALCMAVALIASALTGVTIAYLTDTDTQINVMTVGNVNIELIEQQRDGKGGLEPFEQNKVALPMYESAQDNEDELGLPKAKNYVDKIITVGNIGATEAYVRVLVAFPAGLDADKESDMPLHWNAGNDFIGSKAAEEDKVYEGENADYTNWEAAGTGVVVNIDGNDYNIYSFTRKDAIKPGEETPSACVVGFYLDPKVDCDPDTGIYYYNDKALDYDFSKGIIIPVAAQAVQADGFPDVATAFAQAFGDITSAKNPWTVIEEVGTDEAFEEALNDTESRTISLYLTEDVTYDVAAWQNDAMGGEATSEIVIYGNGHTITFNQTNSDWNNIVTNGAKLVINNANITNAGHNDGPWNRHDLNFACEVELNNVTTDKALAFKAGAKLTNVTINDANTSDTYAIWIQPKGQTVTLDNCTIDMLDCTDGRGIKIDNQYLGTDDEGKVTLVVKDTTFKTEEKSAILVKSTKGADITLEGTIDITEVAADSVNPVWVDEASTAYADLVTVNGAPAFLEP